MIELTDLSLLWVILILVGGTFTQSVSGFGLGLVTMPLLTQLLSLKTATVFLCTISLLINLSLTCYYRRSLQIKPVIHLLIASAFGIILGTYLLQWLRDTLLLKGLGCLIIIYVVWSAFQFWTPQLKATFWSYPFGFLSGIFSGAYNIGGPPIILYGSCRGWTPNTFKSNLNGYFLISNAFVFVNHLLHHNHRYLTIFRQLFPHLGESKTCQIMAYLVHRDGKRERSFPP